MDFNEYQEVVDTWIKKEGVRYFDPMTNMVLLTEEIGELARVMARTYGEQSFKEGEQGDNIADEMADILWVVTALANQCGVNLESAIVDNLDKKNSRDKMRHKKNSKLR